MSGTAVCDRLIVRVRSLNAVQKTSLADTFRTDGFGVEE